MASLFQSKNFLQLPAQSRKDLIGSIILIARMPRTNEERRARAAILAQTTRKKKPNPKAAAAAVGVPHSTDSCAAKG